MLVDGEGLFTNLTCRQRVCEVASLLDGRLRMGDVHGMLEVYRHADGRCRISLQPILNRESFPAFEEYSPVLHQDVASITFPLRLGTSDP